MKRRVKIVLAVCCLILVPVVGLLVLAQREAAVEWSPDEFCHRSVSYVHLLGFRIGQYDLEEWQTATEAYLHENGIASVLEEVEPRWYYVRGNARSFLGGPEEIIGPAYSKCVSMQCFERENDMLVEWSKSNPKMAAVFWPEFVKLAREERYRLLPELISIYTDFDDSSNSPQELREAIAAIQADGQQNGTPNEVMQQ